MLIFIACTTLPSSAPPAVHETDPDAPRNWVLAPLIEGETGTDEDPL